MPDKWIHIVGWDQFQHYKNRRPTWIKLYTELLDKDEYLGLSPGERCLLMELWMLYAQTSARVRLNTRSLSRRFQHRTTSQQLESLNRAGFIRIRASKPLAHTRAREKTPTESSKKPLARRPYKAAAAAAKKTKDEPLRDPEALQKLQTIAEQIGLRP